MKFQEASEAVESPRPYYPRSTGSWLPPIEGFVKVCCDPSFDVVSKMVELAAVIQDCSGQVVGGINKCVHSSSVGAAKALACCFGYELQLRQPFIDFQFQ
ncbi:hypothetical protein V6N12_026952 [Hibiscus sabdariffa]|uniref:RNase H type-1 domain-containing protein n=1 Tax=Hibiscus sabdariffa TaxID=183260 RepID=A0ABR2DUZ7_9ROSI